MSKKRDHSETESLKGIIRNQKAIIKNLKKELSRKSKREHQYSDLEEKQIELLELEEEEQIQTQGERCPKCSSSVEAVDLGVRKLVTCKNCGYRKSIKK